MRLNRKWLYLGGLVAMLTLLLTLTWVLPAGAVGRLDDGALSSEKSFVSPDNAVPADQNATDGTIKVTLDNSDLDSTTSVRRNGDKGPVVINVDTLSAGATTDTIVLEISAMTEGASTGVAVRGGASPTLTTSLGEQPGTGNINILPIIGDVTIDFSPTDSVTRSEVGTPVVRNPISGLVNIPVSDTLEAGDKIYLSYNTSDQETALVNVRGDSENIDLLLVEGATSPGEYSETVVAVDPDKVLMNPRLAPTDGTEIAGVQYGVIHEQHNIPAGLRGFVEVENERVTRFYSDAALTMPVTSTNSVAAAGTVWLRVAHPPIRTRAGLAADGTIEIVADGATDIGTAAEDVRFRAIDAFDSTSGSVVSGQQGILSFTVATDQTFTGGALTLDYFGSDTFTFTVDHGPIDLPDDLDAALVAADAITGATANNAPTIAADQIKIVLPTPQDDTDPVDGSTVFRVVSVENDGNRCQQCKVTLGVAIGPMTDEDEPVNLNARYSVLGISYIGSERATFRRVVVAQDTTSDTGDETYTHTFPVNLRYAPADTDPDTEGMQHDIVFAYTVDADTGTLPGIPAVGAAGALSVALDANDQPRISGRQVWLTTTITRPTFGTTPVTSLTVQGNFDVTYTRQVDALPRNALNPDAGLRPVVAVNKTGRVLVTSGNDSLRINAEGQGPSVSNPSPAHNGATTSNSETIAFDVTDAQSGVDPKSITLTVTVGANEYEVLPADLTVTEIDNGYRASIDLDDVKHQGGTALAVSATADTEISWSVTAKDEAGNSDTSDSNPSNVNEAGDPVDDPYVFRVDGVAPVMERAYTGDWFNSGAPGDGRVEGDRLISPDNYLYGSSKNTSIRVVFSEVMDGSTAEASDFTVDGTAPSGVQWYGKGSTDGSGEEPNEDTVTGEIGRSIFLTVPAMASDATPRVALVGSVSDKAGNAVTSGSHDAGDGIAPGGNLSVDMSLSDDTVTVTVMTDEDIGGAYPDLKFWESDVIDNRDEEDLDETDVFTVGRANPDGARVATNPLVLRNSADQVVFSGDLSAAGDLPLTLSKAPILDWSTGDRMGDVDGADIEVEVIRMDPTGTVDPKVTEDTQADTVVNARSGRINLKIQANQMAVTEDLTADPQVMGQNEIKNLADGDRIVVTYRGTGPDQVNQLDGVPESPAGRRAQDGSNSWTYELSFDRSRRFAVTATMEDDERNMGSAGIGNPKTNGAVVFEIDNQLSGDSESDATSTPADEPAGANPVAFENPFDIELSWPGEADEYVGDTNGMVTLTKAELDGMDVMAYADRQNAYTYIISIEDISLGQHTLTYRAEDAAGNTSSSDRTLEFSVKERPTWDLRLRKGNNLISLPADPSNGDINDVFGGFSEVELVYTFEGNLVQVAIPGPDGNFIGALKEIDSRHAYWISASSAVTVPINIGTTGTRAVLPSLQVKGGQWNLLPVMSLGSVDDDTAGSGAKAGTLVDPDSYFGDFQVAFGSERGRWVRIDPDGPSRPGDDPPFDRLTDDLPSDPPNPDADANDTPIKVGMGYWVLYTEDAFITPR